MKNLAICALILIIAVPSATARRKVVKAGKMKDSVYTDSKYNFQITIHKNWKSRINKGNNPFRLTATQRDYGIPNEYQLLPDYTQIPRLVLYADKIDIGVMPFLDSLLSNDYRSDQKKKILSEFELLNERELIPRRRRVFKLGEDKAVRWDGQAKYMKTIQTSTSTAAGKRVYGMYGGSVVAVKRGDLVVLFYFMCEWEFFESVQSEITQMVNSLTWIEREEKE